MPCLVAVQISHMGDPLPEKASGTWVTFVSKGCTATWEGHQKVVRGGPTCKDILSARLNTPFTCTYITEESLVGGEIGVTEQGVVAAPANELGATNSIWWSTVIGWVVTFFCCCNAFAGGLGGDGRGQLEEEFGDEGYDYE